MRLHNLVVFSGLLLGVPMAEAQTGLFVTNGSDSFVEVRLNGGRQYIVSPHDVARRPRWSFGTSMTPVREFIITLHRCVPSPSPLTPGELPDGVDESILRKIRTADNEERAVTDAVREVEKRLDKKKTLGRRLDKEELRKWLRLAKTYGRHEPVCERSAFFDSSRMTATMSWGNSRVEHVHVVEAQDGTLFAQPR